GVDAKTSRQIVTMRRSDVEDALRLVGVSGRDRPRVDGQALRVVPRGAIQALQTRPGEHLRIAQDRGYLARLVPATWIAARGEPTEVRLGRNQARGRRLRVERVPVLGQVRDPDRGLQVGREKRPGLPYGRRVRIDERARRAGRVEEARERGGDAAEAQPRRATLQRLERRGRLVRADGGRAAAAVDEHEAGEVPGAGLTVEVPG